MKEEKEKITEKAMMSGKKLTLYASLVIVALIGVSLAFAYFTDLRDPVTVAFKRVYPAATINGRILSVNDIEQAGITGAKLGLTKSQAEMAFIENEKAYAAARNLNLSITSDLAADEMRFYVKGKDSEYQHLLKTVFGSENFFYKYVVDPQVVDAQLRVKYYSDIKNTSPAYKRAEAVIERLTKGEKFEDLARSESDDKGTGQIGGDLGFYESGQLIPELEDMISISAAGEFRRDIVISRLGYHIIYPVEYTTIDGKKMWHAKHMLFVPEGYEQWLAQQTSGITVKYIKK